MKLCGVTGTSFAVLVLLGAAMASTASAEAPEFGRCVKVAKGTGVYATAKCTEAGGEKKFEWLPGPGPLNHFTTTIKAGTVATLETVGETHVTCSGETARGEISGTTSVAGVELVLTGCKTLGGFCANRGTELNPEVVFNTLSGQLGVITKGETALKDKVGLDLGPVETEFGCGVNGQIPVTLRGSVIVPVKANSMMLTGTLKFSEAKGKQKPQAFAGGPSDVLEWSLAGEPFEPAGLALTAIQTNEEKVEVNSVV